MVIFNKGDDPLLLLDKVIVCGVEVGTVVKINPESGHVELKPFLNDDPWSRTNLKVFDEFSAMVFEKDEAEELFAPVRMVARKANFFSLCENEVSGPVK